MQGLTIGLPLDPMVCSRVFEGFLSRKMIFTLFPIVNELKSCFSFILSILGSDQIRK